MTNSGSIAKINFVNESAVARAAQAAEDAQDAQDTLANAQTALATAQTELEAAVSDEDIVEATAAANAAANAAQQALDNAAAASVLADSTASIAFDDSLAILTPDSYYDNNNSRASYIGNFNSTPFDSKDQYIEVDKEKMLIPTDTTISMDIDFGKTDDQVSNGKVSVPGYTSLEFDGYFKNDNKLKLEEANGTKGSGGDAYLYGTEGNLIKGDINLKNDDIKLVGIFDAEKGDFIDLTDTNIPTNTSLVVCTLLKIFK